MKKILFVGLIMLLFAVFVSADTVDDRIYNSTTDELTIHIYAGWNIIPNGVSTQQMLSKSTCDVTSLYENNSFYYSPALKQYVGPNFSMGSSNYALWTNDVQAGIYSAQPYLGGNWVYSKNDCLMYMELSSSTSAIESLGYTLNTLKVKQGWNFINLSPQMVGETTKDLFSKCAIEKATVWDNALQKWGGQFVGGASLTELATQIKNNESQMTPETAGEVVYIIKVSNDCYLNFSNNPTGPPELPSGDGTQAKTCGDSDNGSNYLEKGTATGYNVYGQLSTVTDYCGATNSGNPQDKRYVHEYGCNDDGTIYDEDYLCEFGCMNGMCAISETQPVVCETDYFTALTNSVECTINYGGQTSACVIPASTENGHQCTPQPEIRLNVPADKTGYSPIEGLTGTYSGVNCNSTETVYNSSQFFFGCDNKN